MTKSERLREETAVVSSVRSNSSVSVSFCVIYALYFVPFVIAFNSEFGSGAAYHPGGKLAPVDWLTRPLALAAWMLALLGVYVGYRHAGKRFGIKMHAKNPAEHKNDIMWLFVFSGTLFVAGAGERVMTRQTFCGIPFILFVIYFTIHFTVLFEGARYVDISLTRSMAQKPGFKAAVVIVAIAIFTILGCMYAHWMFASKKGSAVPDDYIALASLAWAVHLFMFFSPVPQRICPLKNDTVGCYLHLHHWYWPVPLAHICMLPTSVSMVCQAMFIGAFLHGVACFGAEQIFYPTVRMARHPSEYTWQRKQKSKK